MVKKVLIFDLDGPLLDGRQRHYQCYSDILQENGYRPITIDHYWELKRNGKNRRELLRLSQAENIYDLFLKEWLERIEQKEYLKLDKLQPHTLELLKKWKSCDVRLILITLRRREANLRWQLDQVEILPKIDQLIVIDETQVEASSSVDRGKGKGVSENLSIQDPEECLWVGDTEVDILGARQLKITSCAVTCGVRSEKFLQAYKPDCMVENLQQVYDEFFK